MKGIFSCAVGVLAVLAVCADETVIGAPFYVMEWIEGEVIVTSVPPALDNPTERAHIATELIDALVEIHAVDWRAAGLDRVAAGRLRAGHPRSHQRAADAAVRRARRPARGDLRAPLDAAADRERARVPHRRHRLALRHAADHPAAPDRAGALPARHRRVFTSDLILNYTQGNAKHAPPSPTPRSPA